MRADKISAFCGIFIYILKIKGIFISGHNVYMNNQKLENILNVSLNVTEEEREKVPDLEAGVNEQGNLWELIIKYVGNIEDLEAKYPQTEITPLLAQYAIIVTPRQFIEAISLEEQIQYVEKPKLLYFDLQNGKTASCITSVQAGADNPYGLSGQGALVAIIDTGIDTESAEFKREDGTSRIINILDQTTGHEYDNEQINNLRNFDLSRHGTNVAIIACGNSGVAGKADIIAVKLGLSASNSFPRTTQLMSAVDYCVRKGIEYGKPVVINISIGNNYGSHTGSSLLEAYLDDVSGIGMTTICVGSGNEGLGATHKSVLLSEDTETEVEITVGMNQPSIDVQIWKDYSDDFDVEIITPAGVNLGRVGKYNYVNRVSTARTEVLGYYSQPKPYTLRQEIYINFIPRQDYIDYGIWKIRFIPQNIIVGRVDMWLPSIVALNSGTGFTIPDENLTYTIPSTAQKVITVGAYDSRTGNIAPFSGRGYTVEAGAQVVSKPDLVAPGVNIQINEATYVSGTSFATPFVTGAVALLYEWGIERENDIYLYGEKAKAYLIKGARRLPGVFEYPDAKAGWGALCLADSIQGR